MGQSRKRIVGTGTATVATEEMLLQGLNPEQIEVVKHVRGPLVVAAVAGAGKTNVLVRRIARLVTVEGVSDDRILAVTFSVKAAREMNDRMAKLVPGIRARVGTFHSLAKQIAEAETNAKEYEVDDRDRYRMCIKDAVGFRGMDWKIADLTLLGQFIGLCKARCARPGSKEAEAVAQDFYDAAPSNQRAPRMLLEAYYRAEQLRHDKRMITFDDMLLDAWEVLSTNEEVRQRWAAKWDFVMQDESQDENLVQREIATLLAKDHGNYMVVGDPAQAIYGFRGSDPSGLIAFEAKWGARKIAMARNYRSGSRIIDTANRVLAAMPADTHLGVEMIAERGIEGSVTWRGASDPEDEADQVVTSIQEHRADGRSYASQAVLYRTNAQSRALEEALLGARIPYVVIGGVGFYERKEVKDLLGYLRIAAGRGTFDDVRRCINAPFRFLGKAFVERIEDNAPSDRRDGGAGAWTEVVRAVISSDRSLQARQRESAVAWCRMIERLARTIDEQREQLASWQSRRDAATSEAEIAALGIAPYDLDDKDEARFEARPERMLENLIQETEYIRWITREEGTESPENNRVSNVRELVRAAGRFGTVDSLLDYIVETTRASKAAAEASEEGLAAPDRVTLMSIHRSKGLEWPVVYLIGASEKILPHGRATDDTEERRLFYVAVTRARDALSVHSIGAATFGANVMTLEPSRFIRESGLDRLPAPAITAHLLPEGN